jgi:hypothetical protein
LESAAPPELSLLKLDAFWSGRPFVPPPVFQSYLWFLRLFGPNGRRPVSFVRPFLPQPNDPMPTGAKPSAWSAREGAVLVGSCLSALEAAFVTFSQRFGVRLPLTDRTGIVGALRRTFFDAAFLGWGKVDAGVARTRPDRLLPSIF